MHLQQEIGTKSDDKYLDWLVRPEERPGKIKPLLRAQPQANRLIVFNTGPCHRLFPSDLFTDFVKLGSARHKTRNVISIVGVPGRESA